MLDEKSNALGRQAAYGAAIIFIVQFPGGLYRGFLQAAEEQVVLNSILICCVTLRHLFGVLVLYFWPSLLTYIIWQVVTIALETSLRSHYAWQFVQTKRVLVKFEYKEFQPALRSAIKMSMVVFLGVLTTQLDRILLSGMVPIKQFGFYVIASAVSQGVLGLIQPFVQALAPSIMQSHEDEKTLHTLNVRLTKIIGGIVLIGSALFLVGGKWILNVWMGDPQAVEIMYPLLSILLIGSVLNAFYHVGYYNWLAKHRADRILLVNAAGLLLTLLITPSLIQWKGMIGATFGFVAMNLVSLCISLEWMKKQSATKKAKY